jgi:5'-3' exonuclease
METSLAEDVQEQKMTLSPELLLYVAVPQFSPRAALAVFHARRWRAMR